MDDKLSSDVSIFLQEKNCPISYKTVAKKFNITRKKSLGILYSLERKNEIKKFEPKVFGKCKTRIFIKT